MADGPAYDFDAMLLNRGDINVQLPRVPYLGQVATSCMVPSAVFTNSGTSQMSRTGHFARDGINGLMYIEIPNFYVANGPGDSAVGATSTNTASIEYPAGTFTQVKFGGSVSGTGPDGGRLRSDAISIYIPRGALFFVRIFRTCTAGVLYVSNDATYTLNPELSQVYGGATDLTMGGVVYSAVATFQQYWFGPCAILAMTQRASFGIIGDSRTMGFADTMDCLNRDVGNIARTIGPDYAYVNTGRSAETLLGFNTSSAQRRALVGYCSHQIMEFGVNDINQGANAATVATRFATAIALLDQTKPIITVTMEPFCSTSNAGITSAGFTPFSGNADRITVNNARRAGISGVTVCWEIADIVECNTSGVLTRDGGVWGCFATDGSVSGSGNPISKDGIHANLKGNQFIQAQARVQAKAFGL